MNISISSKKSKYIFARQSNLLLNSKNKKKYFLDLVPRHVSLFWVDELFVQSKNTSVCQNAEIFPFIWRNDKFYRFKRSWINIFSILRSGGLMAKVKWNVFYWFVDVTSAGKYNIWLKTGILFLFGFIFRNFIDFRAK